MSIDDVLMEQWRQEREALRTSRRDPNLYQNRGILNQYGERVTREEQVAQVASKVVTAPEAAEPMEKTIICTPHVVQAPITVLLVGAGGNGARVIPPLMQMLRRRDRLFIMDHDIVEDRNLARQHFTERDIGSPKALVLAQRYRKRDIQPTALVTQLTENNISQVVQDLEWPQPSGQLVMMGCVDNNVARRAMNLLMTGRQVLPRNTPQVCHIDIGNERRGGQVIMSLRGWPMTVTEIGTPPVPGRTYSMRTMNEAMPQLCRPTPWMCDDCAVQNPPNTKTCSKCGREAGTCGNRIDMQTVMVNHMAAGMALNCLSWLMLGIPFSSAGAFFSTLNSIQPIKIKAVDHASQRIKVDTTFAEPA